MDLNKERVSALLKRARQSCPARGSEGGTTESSHAWRRYLAPLERWSPERGKRCRTGAWVSAHREPAASCRLRNTVGSAQVPVPTPSPSPAATVQIQRLRPAQLGCRGRGQSFVERTDKAHVPGDTGFELARRHPGTHDALPKLGSRGGRD